MPIVAVFLIAIFALVLFTGLFLTPAHAEPSTGDMGAEIYVDSSLTFDISPREVVLDLNSANHPFDAKDTLNIVVGTNNTTGYELVMSSNTTDLTTTTSNAKIPTLPTLDGGYTKDTFPDNTWGYRKDGGNYMPFESGKTIMESSTAADRDTTTLGFAAKVNGSQLAGAYAINLNFEVVIRPLPETHTMQNLDPTLCTTTPSTAIDNRDGEEYIIRRLADGECWLLENLRLDISDPAVQANLTSITTNATDEILDYLKNGTGSFSTYSPYPVNGVVAKTATSGSWADTYYNPYIATQYKDTIQAASGSSPAGKIGIYYNYCAASAGSYCYYVNGKERELPGHANYDICPAGWRLPVGGNDGSTGATIAPSKSYYRLYNVQRDFQASLSTPVSGYFKLGSASEQGRIGMFWSSSAFGGLDSKWMFNLLVRNSSVNASVNAGDHQDRTWGISVRCILK